MCVVGPISEASAKRSFGSRTLERPMRGADVRVLQQLLAAWGTPLTADGQFGRQTRRAVRRWERASGGSVDGRVGRREARALKLAVARGDRLPAPAAAPLPTGGVAPAAPVERATIGPDGLAVAPASAPAGSRR